MHEITNTDAVGIVNGRGWHGLGTPIPEGLTPTQAQEMFLPWEIEQAPLKADIPGGAMEPVESHVANYRKDTGERFAIVSAGYVPVQNRDVAEFIEALVADDIKVEIDTIGSIRGGRRVWFLCKGDAFEIGRGDVIQKNLLISNGHDGQGAFRLTPTSTRPSGGR